MVNLSPFDVGLLFLIGIFAGGMGAVLGIGGGILLTPILLLGLSIPIRIVIPASLVSVVATSTAAGSVYVGEGLTNKRLALTLEIATVTGAITGGLLGSTLPEGVLLGVFAILLALTAVTMFAGGEPGERSGRAGKAGGAPHGYEVPGSLAGGFVSPRDGRLVEYRPTRLPLGLAISYIAGGVSGLLGVGGGFIKVPAMRLGMRVPTRVAAATSNFMIGVTAAAGLTVYAERGLLDPLIAVPSALGVTLGALLGTRLSTRVSGRSLARLLAVLMIVAAVEMALRALGARGV